MCVCAYVRAHALRFGKEGFMSIIVCYLCVYRLTVIKESVNKGRQFYTCLQSQNQKCNFFQWADDGPPSATNTERRNNQPQFRGRPFDRGSSPSTRGG